MGRKRKNRNSGAQRLFAAVLLAAALSCGLASCKPTDFFTEVILSPYAAVVDEDNSDAVLVNSPDAEQETDRLSALDWTDESDQTEDVQNLVVYSSAPNTDLGTHHSIFDLSPRFPGIEASDGVRLSYEDAADVDETVDQVPEEATPPEESSTVSPGDAQTADVAMSTASENAPDDAEESPSERGREQEDAGGSEEKNRPAESESSGSGDDDEPTNREGGTSAGDSPEGEEPGPSPDGVADDPNNPGSGHTPSEDNPGGGETEDPYGGYDGTVPVYNPGDAFATVQHADSIAVLGTDAAVMAQAIGGKGAVCAMSDYAYNGLDSSGSRTTTYLAFKDVFGGEAPTSIVLWARDGSSPDDLTSIDALVSACGSGGVLVYDQRLGDQTTLFTDAQRRELYAADIQLVPVELSTVQGMIDAARVMGDALSESHGHGVCALDAKAMSDDYVRAVDDIVRACAATHGGTLGFGSPYGIPLTKYTACPVSSFADNCVYCYLSSDAEAGVIMQESEEGWHVDASKVVLFSGNGDWLASPVFFWQQCAGLNNDMCEIVAKNGLSALWPIKGVGPYLSGGNADGALSRWLSTARQPYSEMFYASDPHSSWAVGTSGIPSQENPYLIVSASGGLSGSDVKALTVASMGSYYSDGTVTPYSILPPDGSLYGGGLIADATHSANLMSSIRGERFLSDDDKLAVADVVRVNPVGLVGSWTEGSMESVLEAVWLTELYSHTANGHPYNPINDMRSYSVTINGQQCSDARSTALAFYRYFYHLDGLNIDEVYSNIAPDSFEGLI